MAVVQGTGSVNIVNNATLRDPLVLDACSTKSHSEAKSVTEKIGF